MSALRNWFALLTIALLLAGCRRAQDENERLPKDLATAKAVVMDLQPKIVERGSLEARDNNDVRCEVKPGKRGCPKIKWVVDNGSQVKKGDLIFQIDDSYLREQAKAAKIALDAARAEVVAAENLLKLKKEVENEVKVKNGNLIFKIDDSYLRKLAQQEALYKELVEQIGKCTIKAPATGIVVYAVPERSSHSAVDNLLDPGEPVQYGTKLLSIPDLSHMLVNLRIHEEFINNMKEKLPVTVRVDALPGKILKGHVKMVDNVAQPQDWMSPDVKVYQSYVEIDDLANLKLKPGLSAVCTICTDPKAGRVLAVPIRAILMPLEKDKKPRCLIVTPRGTEAREVKLGRRDERMVEIKAGLKEGDEVVTDQRLLSDPAPRPAK